ncbi:hypothetical protein C8R46DRAFT_7556 [Mycena filopes]|nr:hypothetical protein C8R46DRAFT_7556 [Mycena filopes]
MQFGLGTAGAEPGLPAKFATATGPASTYPSVGSDARLGLSGGVLPTAAAYHCHIIDSLTISLSLSICISYYSLSSILSLSRLYLPALFFCHDKNINPLRYHRLYMPPTSVDPASLVCLMMLCPSHVCSSAFYLARFVLRSGLLICIYPNNRSCGRGLLILARRRTSPELGPLATGDTSMYIYVEQLDQRWYVNQSFREDCGNYLVSSPIYFSRRAWYWCVDVQRSSIVEDSKFKQSICGTQLSIT